MEQPLPQSAKRPGTKFINCDDLDDSEKQSVLSESGEIRIKKRVKNI